MNNTTPQLEDGYTRIANTLLEALAEADFSKREYKILLVLIRQTYGYNKKYDDITVSKVAEFSGLDRGNTSKTLDDLVRRCIVLKQHGQYGYLLGLNKDFTQWDRVKTTHRVKTTRTPCQNNTVDRVKTTHTKDNLKRQSYKDTPSIAPPTQKDLLSRFWDWWDIYPKKKNRKGAIKIWAKRELDSMADELIADAANRLQNDAQWIEGFAPHPTTYLNGDRWNDDISKPKRNGNGRLSAPEQVREANKLREAHRQAHGQTLATDDGSLRQPLEGEFWTE